MKQMKRILAVLLAVLTIIGCTSIVSFAQKSGGSSGGTIYVQTKANWLAPGGESITLAQYKQTKTLGKCFGSGTTTKTGYYGYYTVKVYNQTTGTSKNVSWNGGQTKKISLERNCTYKITVIYENWWTCCNNNKFNYSQNSITAPSWYVKSTYKVSSCK